MKTKLVKFLKSFVAIFAVVLTLNAAATLLNRLLHNKLNRS